MYLCGTQAMDLGTLLKYEWEIKNEIWKVKAGEPKFRSGHFSSPRLPTHQIEFLGQSRTVLIVFDKIRLTSFNCVGKILTDNLTLNLWISLSIHDCSNCAGQNWLISLRVILSVSVLEVVITSSVFQKWQKNVFFLSNEPVSSDYNFALCSFRTYVWLWLWPSNITLVRSWHLQFHSPPACEDSHINMFSFYDRRFFYLQLSPCSCL